MTTSTKILIGFLVTGVAAYTGYYFLVLKKRATQDQYNEFKIAAIKIKADIEAGLSPSQIRARKIAWSKNLTREDADQLIASAKKGMGAEANTNIEMDEETARLIQKWSGGKL